MIVIESKKEEFDMIEGKLYYDENADRFVVTGNKGKKFFLHC